MLAVVTTMAFMCLGPDALGKILLLGIFDALKWDFGRALTLSPSPLCLLFCRLDGAQGLRRDHIKEAVEMGATCACKEKCICASNECCNEAKGHVAGAKKHLAAAAENQAAAKKHMEQLRDKAGKEDGMVTKLRLQLAAKDTELAKLRAEAKKAASDHKAPSPAAPKRQGEESKKMVVSLERKAAALTSNAIGLADTAATLSAKALPPPFSYKTWIHKYIMRRWLLYTRETRSCCVLPLITIARVPGRSRRRVIPPRMRSKPPRRRARMRLPR